MTDSNTAAVYKSVIEEVVDRMSTQFLTLGLVRVVPMPTDVQDHLVLTQMQQIWESKLAASGVLTGGNPHQQFHLPQQQPQQQVVSPSIGAQSSSSNAGKKPQRSKQPKTHSSDALPGAGDDDDDDDPDDEDGDDNSLGSDLDDSDQDDDDDEQECDHLILCQYEKVTRVKNKWKCTLKDGIINLNGKDFLFSKLNGELHW
ncbi:MAG: hypothetical protein SGCHY_000967 [Lobulomycetales sp.]